LTDDGNQGVLGLWVPVFFSYAYGPSLVEEICTVTYQHCIQQNGAPLGWVLEKPIPGNHLCFVAFMVFVVKREAGREKGK